MLPSAKNVIIISKKKKETKTFSVERRKKNSLLNYSIKKEKKVFFSTKNAIFHTQFVRFFLVTLFYDFVQKLKED